MIIWYLARYGGVVCEFENVIRFVYGCTVMGVQGVKKGAENAALQSINVEDYRR